MTKFQQYSGSNWTHSGFIDGSVKLARCSSCNLFLNVKKVVQIAENKTFPYSGTECCYHCGYKFRK